MSPATHTKFRVVITWNGYGWKGERRIEDVSEHTQRRDAFRALNRKLKDHFQARGHIELIRFRRRVVIYRVDKTYHGTIVQLERPPRTAKNSRPSTNG